jgi:hypothetical protein
VATIEQADVVLVVLTPDYLGSEWAQQELNLALDRRLKSKARVVPLMVRACYPRGFISQLRWVDFTGDYESALNYLLSGITAEKQKFARGEEPGKLIQTLDTVEAESLRREVHEAVELFKSNFAEPVVAHQTKTRAERSAEEKRRCFVVMPFGDPDLQVVYEDFVKPILDRCNLHCERGDDVFGSNVIMEDILKSISAADVVLADLTRKNANVFYEVGICHALDKPVLLLAQSVDDVPFDLRHRRVLLYEYSPRGCKRLETTLRQNLDAVLTELRSVAAN